MSLGETKKTLLEILNGLQILNAHNLQNLLITGICYNSKDIAPGNIFVAINGTKMNGHNFIHEAIRKGAHAIVGEEDLCNFSIPYIQVADARESLAILSINFFGNPSEKLITIGITGTNGKTTTTFLINSILENAGFKTGMIGTVVNKVNKTCVPAMLTTPESPDIQKLMQDMVKEDCKFLSMEVSSQGIAFHRVKGINFDYGAVTNIDLDHTDCHPDFNHYLKTKLNFLDMLGSEQFVALNADDNYYNDFRDACKCNIISYGLENDADIKVVEYRQSIKGIFFVVKITKPLVTRCQNVINPQIIPIYIKLLGKHNIYNALIALTMTLLNDIPLKTIIKSLANFNPITRRCEIIHSGDFCIIDDTALNPHSYDALFDTIKNFSYRKLIVINAIRGNRGLEINMANAKKIVQWIKLLKLPFIITTSSKSNVSVKDRVTALEEKSFLSVLNDFGTNYKHYPSLEDAIRTGFAQLSKGDLLLLLGAQGMDDGAKIALNLLKCNNVAMAK